jgi:Iron-containing redox enzyme
MNHSSLKNNMAPTQKNNPTSHHYGENFAISLDGQMTLNNFYIRELGSPADYKNIPSEEEFAEIRKIENEWNAFEETRINITEFPKNWDQFKLWYENIYRLHHDEIKHFFSYISREASLEDLIFYIKMEDQVDGRFDDVISLAQLGMLGDMKLTLAENYWDEMGMGKLELMHTELFKKSAKIIKSLSNLADSEIHAPPHALKNGNLLLMYALRRRYSPRLLGALTILEHTAPYRFQNTVSAMERLNIPHDAIYYHRIHVDIDENHGNQLFNRVLKPLIQTCPESIEEICKGCLIRFNVALDYYKCIAEKINVNFY